MLSPRCSALLRSTTARVLRQTSTMSSASHKKTAAPYGSWKSPLTSDVALGASISFADCFPSSSSSSSAGKSSGLVWLENRPSEGGRTAIVHSSRDDGKVVSEVIPDNKFSARSRVHEYGGGAAAALPDGSIVFSSTDGPLYRVSQVDDNHWSEPEQITPKSDVLRFADFSAHSVATNLLLAVQEDHTIDEPAKVVNSLVVLDMTTSKLYPVQNGADFYSAPRFSPSGRWMCFVSWMHPKMPWSESCLHVARVAFTSSGGVDPSQVLDPKTLKLVAGKSGESVSQPRWAIDDEGNEEIVFLSDRTGYYQLYRYSTSTTSVTPLASKQPDVDIGQPDWVFGQATHGALDSKRWLSRGQNGTLDVTDLKTGSTRSVETPFASLSVIRPLSSREVAVVASSHSAPPQLAILTLSSDGPETKVENVEVLKKASEAQIDEAYISVGEPITYPTKAVKGEVEVDAVSHAIWYSPTSKDYRGDERELPPLVVHCHGGPTSSASIGLAWSIQYFTSRGFAYVDVDYGGSVGYGKAFRDRLDSNWGLCDVDDTVACVKHLVRNGRVDPKRVAITGGSAGGFTVLAALCTSDVFAAGTSLYGISDLNLLAGDTHKFESQYLFGLLGGTPEEVPDAYHDRSPIHHATKITAPLLILQGSIDRVVPPEQATRMAETIKKSGGKSEIIVFEGEGHGFRKAENKKRAMEEEVRFYRETFGIKADDV